MANMATQSSMFDVAVRFFVPSVDANQLVTLKMCVIAVLLLCTPFIYDVFAWFMFTVDSLGCALTMDVNTIHMDRMFSYNYLKDRNLIPLDKLNDRKYITDRIVHTGFYGLLTCFGVCGLISPASLKY